MCIRTHLIKYPQLFDHWIQSLVTTRSLCISISNGPQHACPIGQVAHDTWYILNMRKLLCLHELIIVYIWSHILPTWNCTSQETQDAWTNPQASQSRCWSPVDCSTQSTRAHKHRIVGQFVPRVTSNTPRAQLNPEHFGLTDTNPLSYAKSLNPFSVNPN